MLIVSWFICGILYFFAYSYLFCTMICKRKLEISYKFLIIYTIMASIYCLVMLFGVGYIKPYIMHILAFIMLFILYKQKLIKTLLGLLIIVAISFISEFIVGIIGVLIFEMDFSLINDNYIYYVLLNFFVLLICYLISKIKFVKNLTDHITEWYNQNEYKSLIFFAILIFIILTFALYNNFINILPKNLLIIANLFFVATFIFIICFFRENASKNKIIFEYDQLFDYIQIYEKLLNEKSKNQHEYKNQLAVIKYMIKNKDAIEYIESLLKNEEQKDFETKNKLMYIPKGGLKGLIYYKIDEMKKKKLNMFIDISSELKNSKWWVNCNNNLQNVSKILGVYLDNAIEASENSDEKYIIFEVYAEDENTVFKISNTFSNKIYMDKIDKEGYSTKGKGKGYGLSLAKELIEETDCLSQARELNGIYYIQKLYVKNKV